MTPCLRNKCFCKDYEAKKDSVGVCTNCTHSVEFHDNAGIQRLKVIANPIVTPKPIFKKKAAYTKNEIDINVSVQLVKQKCGFKLIIDVEPEFKDGNAASN